MTFPLSFLFLFLRFIFDYRFKSFPFLCPRAHNYPTLCPPHEHSLVLSLTSSPSDNLEDPTPPPSPPLMEYNFGGRPVSRFGQTMRAPKKFPIHALPPRSSTFACLQRQSPEDDDLLKLECKRIARGLRHFPAQAMAIVGVSPTGEPWETPPLPHREAPPDDSREDEGEYEDPGCEEEECSVPLLGNSASG